MKHFVRFFATVTLGALLFGAAGCAAINSDDDRDDAGDACYLSVSTGLDARTILPTDVTNSSFTKAELLAATSGNAATIIRSWSSYAAMTGDTSLVIAAGTYDFTLNLYVLFDGSEQLCQTGRLSDVLIQAGTNPLSFATSYVTDGTGNLAVTLSWAKDARVASVKAGLFSAADYGATAVAGYALSALYSKSAVPAGTYFVRFELYAADGTLLNTYKDAVRVAAACKTTAAVTVANINTPYTITYDLNGGDWASGCTPTAVHNSSTAVALPTAADVTRAGYSFLGWNTAADGSGTTLTTLSNVAQDYVLYAQWFDLSSYYIAFDANGGTGSMATKTLTQDVAQELPANAFTYSGYIFDSWNTQADGKGITYSDRETVKNLTATGETTITLYARWTKGIALYASKLSTTSFTSDGTVRLLGAWMSEDLRALGTKLRDLYWDRSITLDMTYATGITELYEATTAEEGTFYKCFSLVSVKLPATLKKINAYAFYECVRIKNLYIPVSVISIGNKAFYYYKGMTLITRLAENKSFVVVPQQDRFVYYDGTLEDWLGISCFDYYSSPFYGVTNSLTKSLTGKTYAPYLYIQNERVTDVTIPASITSIGSNAFCSYSSLEKVTIPSSVTSIGNCVFWGCTSLANVDIPASVTSIGFSAFRECTTFTSMTIPDGITTISNCMFMDCTALASVEIPASVTSINAYAFKGCTGLTSIIIPDDVTSIGDEVFYGCTGLTSITLPAGVTSLGGGAFRGCTSLASITIPVSVTSIGEQAFFSCTALSTIRFAGTKAQWAAITKGTNWNAEVPATTVICSDGSVDL